MRLAISLVSSLALAISAQAQVTPRSCDLEFPPGTRTRANVVTDPSGKRIVFLGGGVVARCIGQGNNLTADSAQYYEAEGRLFLVGNVHYTEPRATVDSRTMTYYQRDDHLHAEGDVVAVMSNGSTLRGPSADYYRSTAQRPVARMFAPGRPRVTLVQRDTTGRGRPPDTAHVVANRITMEGDSLVYAAGRVEVTRPDLLATGDSAFLDSGRDFARLMREPLVKGMGKRVFTLTGGVVDVYSNNRQLERVVATPNGHALSQDLELVADTIDLRLQQNELQRAIAWGAGRRARALSPEREIVADSIDALLPGQRVREVRALRNAYAESNPDSGVVSDKRDWIRGDTIIARFDTAITTDTASRARIRELVAAGNARSFYQMKSAKATQTQPTINYVRGRIIDIDFQQGNVSTVTVTDRATGVMIEPVVEPAAARPVISPAPARPRPPENLPNNRR
jgi:hypothetical protein